MIASMIAKKTAFQNPHTSNHSSKLLAKSTSNTLINQLTSHNVIQFKGSVSVRSTHHTVQLSNDSTTATMIADRNHATSTHGSK